MRAQSNQLIAYINRVISDVPIVNDVRHYGRVLVQDFMRADLTKQASAMAYITVFSLVPSLAAVFALLSLFLPVLGDQAYLMDKARAFILSNLASGTGDTIVEYLDQFLRNLDLKRIGFASFAFLFVSLILLLRQIEEALNRIWFVTRSRNMILRFVYFWTLLTLGTFVIAIVLGLSADFNIRQYFGGADISEVAQRTPFVGALFGWAMWGAFFFLVYRFIPNCFVSNKSALISAVIGGTIFYWGSHFYGVYVRDYNNYKTIYGTLAAIPVFLLWIYLCWLVVLFGSMVGWRFQQGFPDRLAEESVEIENSPDDILRNNTIKSALPLVILLLIYKKFEEGSGKGVNHNEVVQTYKLPEHWINDAVDSLKYLGYIVENSDEGSITNRRRAYFPSMPADKVDIDRLNTQILEPFDKWSSALSGHVADEMLDVLRPVRSMLKPHIQDTNVLKLVKKMHEPGGV